MRFTICILLILHQQGLVSLQECYTCPSGIVGLHEHAGSCYYFSPSGLNHAEASDLCSEHEYHLAFIESVEEQDYIRTYMEENNIEDCWMGLTVNSAGEGVWLDGSLLTYENFEDNSFNEGGECFRIAASYDYHWHDRGCSHIFSCICEKEIGHQKSNRFGMIAQNSSIKEIAVAEKHTASTLVQCASACMTMSSCSSFTFIEVDRVCLIGGPATSIDSENFERRKGAKTFGII